jgi:GH15 family glucan-1,4-alpha-glucosidase
MQDLGMLNKIYVFNNSVKELKTDLFSIANLATCGGTSINVVIDHIKKHPDNALIITDAEDCCSHYSEKAFFIGVKGARFDHFDKKTMQKYSESGQAVVFDGNKIFNVNHKGQSIN